jgi:putative transposase
MHAKKKTFTYKEQCPVKQETYLTQLQMALVNGKIPVFVDESGFTTESVRQFAYAPGGVCVSDKISSNRYRCTTLIAAQIQGRFTAPVLFEGACDALAFNAWLENVLCPLLDTSHVVILDNASFHKSQQTEALIAACGASLLFLPPYSPEFNPIERDFANIKRKWEYNAEASIDEIVKMYK